jgi:alpha-glucosidase
VPNDRQQWWQNAVIYEIAAISFQDSNGDGKGDIPGLISRLDYLEWLGIDAVWLTPIYPSPFRDFGYDISEFCAIDPMYGSMADFDRLLAQLHGRGIRLILDFVPNHTSADHPWFAEARAARNSAKRDWYVWADAAADGGPPNNWRSRFGGSAWTWDEGSSQYYYHAFLEEQPDLNWRSPALRAAMADVLRFWMERGVDGFRVDASAVLAEDALLRDDPPNPEADENTPPPSRLKRIFTDDRPESMTFLEEIRAVVDEFPERVLAGEVQGKIDRIGHFYGNDRPRLHLPLNFALLDTEWDGLSLQAQIDAYLNVVPKHAWPNWVIGGHDKKRIASKLGQNQARILAMLLLTLRGTPFLFAGDEIGMEQVEIPADCIQDPFEKLVPGYGLCRDPERAPLAWQAGPSGGFTTGEPWLPMAPDAQQRNVAAMTTDPKSLLSLYRALITLRRKTPQLRAGEMVPLRGTNDLMLFKRRDESGEILVVLNLVHQPRRLELAFRGTRLLSTRLDGGEEQIQAPYLLMPDEGMIVRLED